jgi:hypothetical protein
MQKKEEVKFEEIVIWFAWFVMVLDGDWENLCLGLPNTHQTLRGKGQPNVK